MKLSEKIACLECDEKEFCDQKPVVSGVPAPYCVDQLERVRKTISLVRQEVEGVSNPYRWQWDGGNEKPLNESYHYALFEEGRQAALKVVE